MSKYKGKEKLMEVIFLIAACISIISVVLICIFLFMNGIPAMKKIGFGDFIFGQRWRPGNNIFGIWPMILGSIYVTGSDHHWSTNRCIVCNLSCEVLSKRNLQNYQTGCWAVSGNPIGCIWIFRTGRTCTVYPQYLWRKRKQYFNGIHTAWNHDTSNDHRSIGISDPCRTE